MNFVTAGEVQRAKAAITKSGLAPGTKENLHKLVDLSAAAANGHSDKIQGMTDSMLALSLHTAHCEVGRQEQIRDEVASEMARHTVACPWRAAAQGMPPWAMRLYAFRWQLGAIICVGMFAPQASELLRTILTFYKR